MQNFGTLGKPLLGEKQVARKRKKEKKNNHKNSGHFLSLQRPWAAHPFCSDQFDTIAYLYIMPK
jgi:hypothetical protein